MRLIIIFITLVLGCTKIMAAGEQFDTDVMTPRASVITNNIATMQKEAKKIAAEQKYGTYTPNRPWIDLTIDKAPGILDVLTTALFGKRYDDKPLWFEIEYEGSIDLLDSYVRTE